MKETKIIDILAYYLSEYDNKAFSFLGYKTQSSGFVALSKIFGCKDSYIRRLRDEYDVVTSSSRHGQRNRPPRKRILEIKALMQNYTFEELSEMICSIIENIHSNVSEDISESGVAIKPDSMSEQELEQILNFSDPNAHIKVSNASHSVRVYNTGIIRQLKKLYGGKCQLCGNAVEIQGRIIDISEAHHIDYFSESENNNIRNLLIICPNHHALIHKLNPSFDRESLRYVFEDEYEIPVVLNYHL